MIFRLCAGLTRGRGWSKGLWAIALGWLSFQWLSAEIIFHDSFSQPAGSVTNSVPWIDVQGNGWLTSGLELDGQGHLFNPTVNKGAAAGVQLIPVGPHGSLTVSTTLKLPAGSPDWIGFGFGSSNHFVAAEASKSGPWVKVQGNGAITLYGGSGENNPLTTSAAFTNSGSPVKFVLVCDAFANSASVAVVQGGVTNPVFNLVPMTNSLRTVTARYLNFQFPASASLTSSRWMSDVSVDWFPRPRPLLALPTPPTANVIHVGPPTGQSDIHLIQTALNTAAALTNGAEVRFSAGATYLIATNTTAPGVPLILQRAANVLVNGNGCNILITNPRIGFLDTHFCTNVIIQGFTVDYDPLPFTQGVVTANLAPAEAAFEFRVDPGYPAPTNSNFLEIAQWGTFMDKTRPGRLADNHSTIYEFRAVAATKTNGIFKLTLHNKSKSPTIQVGDIWCQLARFNGSTVFRTRFCQQVTFLNLTCFTGAAAAFAGNGSSLVSEVNCNVVIGPSPGGTNGVPRIKTTNADGGLFGNPRIGPWVEGCTFIGLSDDVANANTLPFFIDGTVTGPTNRFHLVGYNPGGSLVDIGTGDVLVGDDVTFYNGTNGVVMNRAMITAVNPPFVTFDRPISGVFPGLDTTNTLIFDHSLNSSAVYLNNRISNSRIHGIYCRANNMLVAHNVISGMGTGAIAAHPSLSLAGPNSFIPTNLVIMANVLSDGGCSYEAINNVSPADEPTWALLQLHKAIATSDYVPSGAEISGIRILNNAFLQWRRGAITLHNVSDTHILGNYFGPPQNDNGLEALTNHVAVELWASDYASLRWADNVKSKNLSDAQAVRKDGVFATIPGAFTALASPELSLAVSSNQASVSWNSLAPGFVIQAADAPDATANWVDLRSAPSQFGASNSVSFSPNTNVPHQYYRVRQR